MPRFTLFTVEEINFFWWSSKIIPIMQKRKKTHKVYKKTFVFTAAYPLNIKLLYQHIVVNVEGELVLRICHKHLFLKNCF